MHIISSYSFKILHFRNCLLLKGITPARLPDKALCVGGMGLPQKLMTGIMSNIHTNIVVSATGSLVASSKYRHFLKNERKNERKMANSE